tara:strand:+ start:9585 stop:10121 length:537 start_codon:yes stop_codon:yes gene_type:complete
MFSALNLSCNKNTLTWNLERNNPLDSVNWDYTLVEKLDCEDLSEFQVTATGIGCSSCFYWEVNSGYIGNGMHMEGTPNGTIASLTFPIVLNKRGVVRFWINGSHQKPDFTSCDVEVNGSSLEKFLFNEAVPTGTQFGWVDWFQWWNIQSDVIEAGNYDFTIWVYSNTIIDEIEVFEVN